jgi:diguanylate cyclase (GGDEF)-like protein
MAAYWVAPLDDWLRRRSRATILAAAFAIVVALGYLDLEVAPDLAPLVYLGPVALVAWYAGLWPADLIALASGVTWLVAHGDRTAPGIRPGLLYWDLVVRVGAWAVVAHTVAALRGSLDRERASARTDPLTGIANLRALSELAEVEIAFARRYKRALTAIYVDLDAFKAVNDRLGHAVGDEVLRVVARAIRDALRVTDLVARLGGDEFLIMLPETNAEQSALVIRKVRDALGSAAVPNGAMLSASFGVVTYGTPPASLDEIIQTADGLMYHAKERGKGGIKTLAAD